MMAEIGRCRFCTQSPRTVHHPPPEAPSAPPPPTAPQAPEASSDRVMLVRALPPQYSTFTVACEHCHSTIQQPLSSLLIATGRQQNGDNDDGKQNGGENQNGGQDGRLRSSFSISGNQQIPVTPSSYSVPTNLTMVPGSNNTTLTNTVSGEQYRILVPTSSPDSQQRSIPRMPPSYSSVFRAGCAVLISEDTGETYIATKDDCVRYE